MERGERRIRTGRSGTHRPLEVEAKELTRKKARQAAKGMVIVGEWRQKGSSYGIREAREMQAMQRQLDEAATALGENPHRRGSAKWNKWNERHYIEPARKQLEDERKRR